MKKTHLRITKILKNRGSSWKNTYRLSKDGDQGDGARVEHANGRSRKEKEENKEVVE